MGALMSDYCSDAARDQVWIITTSGPAYNINLIGTGR
ncbi:hypothetical protein M758_4G205800 [Ceratodon purpureus]|nr:hypothetical protein M758_4G205800 [Ceratodon purpureus]